MLALYPSDGRAGVPGRRVVVTGVGAVSPLGVGAQTLFERWAAGVSGIKDGAGACDEYVATDHFTVKEARRAEAAFSTFRRWIIEAAHSE